MESCSVQYASEDAGDTGPAGADGVDGQGVPTGGTAGQVLSKIDGTDYNTHWVAQSGGASYQNPIDSPPSTPHAKDDEFNGTSLDGKWSWVNRGAATASVSNGNLYIDMLSGGDHSRLLVQEAPTGDFVCTAKVSMVAPIESYLRNGIVLYNSANGNRIIFGYRINRSYYGTEPSVGGVKCQNSSWTDDLPVALINNPYIYARVSLASGTLTFDWSTDGEKWINLTSETVSNYLGAITHIGIGTFRNNGDGKTYFSKVDWFRVIE